MTDSTMDVTDFISQIEDMLKQVAGHTVVSAADMQNGLLDLMQSARSMALSSDEEL